MNVAPSHPFTQMSCTTTTQAPTTTMQSIVDINNEGVRLLDAGFLERARLTFKDALEQTTETLGQHRGQMDESSCWSGDSTPSILRVPVQGSRRGFSKESSGSYLYRYALAVDTSNVGSNVDSATPLDYQYSLRLTCSCTISVSFITGEH